MLTVNQESKAIHYSVLFLRNEQLDLEKTLKNHYLTDMERKLLSQRLNEINNDLVLFEDLNR